MRRVKTKDVVDRDFLRELEVIEQYRNFFKSKAENDNKSYDESKAENDNKSKSENDKAVSKLLQKYGTLSYKSNPTVGTLTPDR